jgi:hypothetical protein
MSHSVTKINNYLLVQYFINKTNATFAHKEISLIN